jgi:protein-S-isoprenylcysteine O-methyltransferase Ste14
MPYAAALLFLVILVFWLFDRGIPTSVSRPMWLVLLGAVMVLVGLAAIYWTFRVGDSGARAVWEPILAKAGPAGG